MMTCLDSGKFGFLSNQSSIVDTPVASCDILSGVQNYLCGWERGEKRVGGIIKGEIEEGRMATKMHARRF